ncbi:hypothetical protein Tco_0303029 [Tanacetum coccineum]
MALRSRSLTHVTIGKIGFSHGTPQRTRRIVLMPSLRRRVLIREMEALGERGVAVDSFESLKQTHARETAKLAALTNAIAKSLAGIREK